MCVFIWTVRLALSTVSALETVRNGLKDGCRFPTTPFFIRLERISCCQSSWPGFPVSLTFNVWPIRHETGVMIQCTVNLYCILNNRYPFHTPKGFFICRIIVLKLLVNLQVRNCSQNTNIVCSNSGINNYIINYPHSYSDE